MPSVKKHAKLEINPEMRLKALSREQLNAIVDLFGPRGMLEHMVAKKFVDSAALLTKYAGLGWMEIDSPGSKKRMKVFGTASPIDGIRIDNIVSLDLPNRRRLRSVMGHESEHLVAMLLSPLGGKNHLCTASAIELYFSKPCYSSQVTKSQFQSALKRSALIEAAFASEAMHAAIKRQEGMRDAEYRVFLRGKSFRSIGAILGQIAIRVEHETRKPGIGMFVIREVSKGIAVSRTIDGAVKGKYEAERRIWLGRHPIIRDFIIRRDKPITRGALVERARKEALREREVQNVKAQRRARVKKHPN